MSRVDELHAGSMDDPAYRNEYDHLEGGYAIAAALIRDRDAARPPLEARTENV